MSFFRRLSCIEVMQRLALGMRWPSQWLPMLRIHDLTSLIYNSSVLVGRTETVIHQFGKALRFGSKYVYQSLPRLLTLWLDMGAWPEVLKIEREGLSNKDKAKYVARQIACEEQLCLNDATGKERPVMAKAKTNLLRRLQRSSWVQCSIAY